MADVLLIEQLYLNVLVPNELPEPQVEAARRVLDSQRFRKRLERGLRVLFRKHCALRRLRVRLSA